MAVVPFDNERVADIGGTRGKFTIEIDGKSSCLVHGGYIFRDFELLSVLRNINLHLLNYCAYTQLPDSFLVV